MSAKNSRINFSLLLLYGIFWYQIGIAQIQTPHTPSFQQFQPVQTNQSHSAKPNFQTSQPTIQQQTENEIKQKNIEAIKKITGNMPFSQEEIKAGYGSNFSQVYYNKFDEVWEILREIYDDEKHQHRSASEFYKSAYFISGNKNYETAYYELKQMAEGNMPISIKRAYYIMEAAYGDVYLTYEQFDSSIKKSARFIKDWLRQQKLSPTANNLHYGIQRLMKDTLRIDIAAIETGQTIHSQVHYPFRYDYVDFKGETDHRNYFVTKAFATGYGQCSGLPLVYYMLAEELGITAYLSFAPHHLFIKYPNAKGYIENYEATTNHHITDHWYEEHLFITPEAKRYGIFLDTLNAKMILANCFVDLGIGYLRKFGLADGSFVNKCIQASEKYYGAHHNIYISLLKSDMLSRQLVKAMMRHNMKSSDEIYNVQEVAQLYEALMHIELTIEKLGFQPLPEKHYELLMQQQEFKANMQQNNRVTGKETRPLTQTIHSSTR